MCFESSVKRRLLVEVQFDAGDAERERKHIAHRREVQLGRRREGSKMTEGHAADALTINHDKKYDDTLLTGEKCSEGGGGREQDDGGARS
jgi:hypothetical protein